MSTKTAYKKAFNGWVESQKSVIRQVEMNISNSENMIEGHTEAVKVNKKALKFEKELLEKAIAEHESSES